MKTKLFVPVLRFGLLVSVFVLFGASCGKTNSTPNLAPITVWGIFDNAETMRPFIQAFTAAVPGAKVEYKKVSPVDSYEQTLRVALSERRGPDVFLVNNSWMPRWKDALLPAPTTLVPVSSVSGGQGQFVDVVGKDMIWDNRVMGLPLFVDTLGLYYNKDLFNSSGIARPPRTWQEVQEIVKRVTKFNKIEPNQIDSSGIAMGTGANVNRASDILSILMMQNGVTMLKNDGMPAFGESADAVGALNFYTNFANTQKDVYTWNPTSHYSIDSFAEGSSAMMINYSYNMETIRAKNPRLNFAVASLPQVDSTSTPVSYANYWALAVSGQSTNPDIAWRFVKFMTDTAQARTYLEKSGYPPARRDLVQELQNDSRIGVFAKQALNGVSWKQADNRVVDELFTEAADAVVAGQGSAENMLKKAAEQLKAVSTSTVKSQ